MAFLLAIPQPPTGFLMRQATPQALLETIRRAIATYRDAARWREMQRAGMAREFGWGPAAQAYRGIYERIGKPR